MNSAVFRKTEEKMQKDRDTKFVLPTEKRRNYLVSRPNYHTAKCFLHIY